MKALTAVPTATAWRHHDYATPRFLRQQSMRHPDELTPWILAVIWLSAAGLGVGVFALIGYMLGFVGS